MVFKYKSLKKQYISLLTMLALFIFSVNSMQSQIISKTKGQILLRGWLLDSETNEPIEADIRIENEEGKSFKISSNSITGKFEQILESGNKYKMKCTGKTILTKEFEIEMPIVDNYSEIADTFYIQMLKIGRTMSQYDLFKPNSAEFNSEADKILEDLNTQLRFNRDPDFFLTITGCDSKEGFTQIVTSPSKSKSKKQTAQTKFDQVGFEKLLETRIELLNSKIANYDQLKNRIEIKSNPAFNCDDNQTDAFLIVKDIKSKMK